MAGILGKKVGMTSVFTADGKNVPCTVIQAGPCVVTQVRTKENDGYEAYQLAFDDKKEKHTTKPMLGHFAKAGTTPKRYVAEFTEWDKEYKLGDVLQVGDVLSESDMWVDVIGLSKGRGFQGVVKRHGFNGVGEETHGQHNRLRAPGVPGDAHGGPDGEPSCDGHQSSDIASYPRVESSLGEGFGAGCARRVSNYQ